MKKAQFIIAAPTSNAGKTTVTLGLLRALKNRKISAQPFKCGPDYIDPKFHQLAGQKTGVNLDLFMMSKADLRASYFDCLSMADVACVEGVMGLFDGAKRSEGSTAELAKVLDIPIVFVVNAKATAYSVAPLLYGFKNFDPALKIAGVIFNRVNTASHYAFLKEACEDVGLTALGYLPALEDAQIPSRHLGLSIDKIEAYDPLIERFSQALEQTVDLNQLLENCTVSVPEPYTSEKKSVLRPSFQIAVAKDNAFNFCYEQTIKAFERKGRVVYFSPLEDEELPIADFVYFPGGYPECYLDKLSANHSMLASVRKYAANGGRIWAECGGMMYLAKAIIDKEGKAYKMVGCFDFVSSMQQMKLKLGYRTMYLDNLAFKGHEFHYSTLLNHASTPHLGFAKTARNQPADTMIYSYKNVLASYAHLYFGTDDLLEKLLKLTERI
ncbi:cobyrinate a,c-diamide synthase [Aureispira anguillae]|uniref:Cobyrinate a,c-diamide synthase n=1 Tax=Aureispira anguillae TaxID=2864201 RepID=A0A915YDP1_9BACT|nr:cobyrinate a,c-diamide synthase [Aureispira anguillae]BDS11195.1 cobyrinate a,c-diamide synthase [Aureispira anguillae]